MNTLCAALLAWAVQTTGIEANHCPQIVMTPAKGLSELVCDGRCNVYGLYHDGTIYLAAELDMGNTYHRSFLLHELAHYLQDVAGRIPARGCRQHMQLEREAYALQHRYLRMQGSRRLAGTTVYGCH